MTKDKKTGAGDLVSIGLRCAIFFVDYLFLVLCE